MKSKAGNLKNALLQEMSQTKLNITDFDMSDDYISLTYRQFEIINVSPTIYKHPSIFSVKSKEYFIDNTLRGWR